MNYKDKYLNWLNSNIIPENLKTELKSITDEKDLEDRFYKNLEFGTGGLRGIMGAGSNRMNVITVSQASQGFADYLNNQFENPSVAIAYDSRNMSKEFAEAAALTLVANNIQVYLHHTLEPTPVLSYSVRYLNCNGGIVVTASHNPKEYNGYKVYDEFGGQVTDFKASEIISYVNKITDFNLIKTATLDKAIESKKLIYIGKHLLQTYIDSVKALTIRKELVKEHAEDLKVIYTPIHGTGNIPVRQTLDELGYKNVKVVKEQELPDGNFSTVVYPNPEDSKVFKIALEMAKEDKPDIIIGTDPDCDRIGVVVRYSKGEYKKLTGNQTGILLTEYILSSLKELNSLPSNGFIVKTIVTTEVATQIAKYYGVELIDVLTGFKYIGEKIRELSDTGLKKFLFGFEESYGYLSGTFVRDKDAVIASTLISEMTLYYKTKGLTLVDALNNIYKKYGYFKEDLVSIELKGQEGERKISNCMKHLREFTVDRVNNKTLLEKWDFKLNIMHDLVKNEEVPIILPKSNVLKFVFEDNYSVVVRPSGTEAKIKIYLSLKSDSENTAKLRMESFKNNILNIIEEFLE